MKNKLPAVLLAVICIVLGISLYSARKENTQLKQQLAVFDPSSIDQVADSLIPEKLLETEALASTASNLPLGAESDLSDEKKTAGRQMMSNLSKMMENPTMNKVMEASQRGAIGALYSDLIEYLDLDADETEYFMELLMYRQMKNVDLGMKMMGGGMDEEEKAQMTADLKEADDTVQKQMEEFLNSDKDYEEFAFYEKTMGERMMLSSMDQKLTGSESPLNEEAYRGLLDMMHEEKTNFDFSTDLHDEKNTDLSPERFSKENLTNFSDDLDQLNELLIQRAQSMLTTEQLQAFEEAIKTTSEMQKTQLEMAGQMFGGGD
jgi:hypothetical protein